MWKDSKVYKRQKDYRSCSGNKTYRDLTRLRARRASFEDLGMFFGLTTFNGSFKSTQFKKIEILFSEIFLFSILIGFTKLRQIGGFQLKKRFLVKNINSQLASESILMLFRGFL
jgi:hypothetical protein